ncbi:MAG: hypothetical protein EP329_27430 [Deltaproteobacteria bacterium]|nr:MAG: hypothetical protein EP329_27430 [Deltaproteobacteria bacterium]
MSLSDASIAVDATPEEDAVVTVSVTVHVLGKGWSQVPLLPAGTALVSAYADGRAIALTPMDGQLAWLVETPGSYVVSLRYRVPRGARRGGGRLAIPVPGAAVQTLTASLPGTDVAPRVVPSLETTASSTGSTTTVTASLGQTELVRLDWGTPEGREAVVAEARYAGHVGEATVAWTATLIIEVLAREPVLVPLLRDTAAVSVAQVDGRPALLAPADGLLRVRLPGPGRYTVTARFETPVVQGDGPTATTVWLPRPAIAALTVTATGDKHVSVSPGGSVTRRKVDGETVATAQLPPASEVVVSWSDARPEDELHVLRANAEVFHVVVAQEGVLQLTGHVVTEIARGRASRFLVAVPPDVAVNSVTGEGVVDWRLAEPDADGKRVLTVYLDREVTGEHRYEVSYERLVPPGSDPGTPVRIPLLTPLEVHRQRGMVALVHGDELQMTPSAVEGLSPVGENQLPAWLEPALRDTVTHTYKYVEPDGTLAVALTPFEKPRPRYDARVDLLASIADGAISGIAGIDVVVKSGELDSLELLVPEGINVLGVTAPSLRDHHVDEASDGAPRQVRLAFTRALSGTLRIEVVWERVLAPGEKALRVPLVHVAGAALEQGTVAVEALAAVEVEATTVERMQPIDARDLPQSLILRTTNPILLAYRYVHADPPAALELAVRRHADVEVQVAAIDLAAYSTLWTADGVVLTRARYTVRNRGKQFLRVTLPIGAKVWSAELAGQPVKPARGDDERVVLVPLLNTVEPFSAELVYVTERPPLGAAGTIAAALPVPDIVQTRTSWDVFLPETVTWGEPDTRMQVVARPGEEDAPPAQALGDVDANGHLAVGGGEGALPLKIEVPARGAHLGLTQLLANQAGGPPSFSLRYTSRGADALGALLAFFGALALGLLVVRLLVGAPIGRPPVAIAVGVLGATAVVVALAVLGAAWVWPVAAGAISLVAGLVLGVRGRSALGGHPDRPEPV